MRPVFARVFLVWTLALSLFSTSIGGVGAATMPHFEPSACAVELPTGQQAGKTVDCGFVVVPELHARPDGAALRLAVARFHATKPNPAPEPVIYLSGGPGGPGLTRGFLARYVPIFAADRDFIVFDQRGTGTSEPALDCPEATAQGRADDQRNIGTQEAIDNDLAAVAACRERLAGIVNLGAYSSVESAADVNDIRMAFGYDKINLLGISYGTRLALTVLRDFAPIVRSTIIDSVSPLQVDNYAQYTVSFDRAVRLLFADCAAAQACNRQYPNLHDDFSRVVAQLNAQPVTVAITDPKTHARYDLVITGTRLVGLMHNMLYIKTGIGRIPAMLAQLRNGKKELLQSTLTALYFTETSEGMAIAVRCTEYAPFSNRENVTNAARDVLPEVAAEHLPGEMAFFSICEKWPTRLVDPRDHQPVASDVPTLVLESANDPTTPPAFGQLAAQTLSRSFYIETPGIGHSVLSNGADCGTKMATDFLANPDMRPDSGCTASLGVTYVKP